MIIWIQYTLSHSKADHMNSNSATSAPTHVTSSTSDDPTSNHMTPISDHVTAPRSGRDIINLLGMTSSKDHMTSPIVDITSELTYPMFGVCATVKRTGSLDTPPNVTNQLQSFDDNVFDNDQKENFILDDNLLQLEEECLHDNTRGDNPIKLSHNSLSSSCHGNNIGTTWRTSGIKRNVQLFNSPYMVNSSVAVSSNKKRKTVSTCNAITMVTNTGVISTTKSKPSTNNKLLIIIPSMEECQQSISRKRDHVIHTCYDNVVAYHDTLHYVILEHINIILYDVISRYHQIMNKIDYSAISLAGEVTRATEESGTSSNIPCCKHGPAQLRTVKKEGVNKVMILFHYYGAVDKCNVLKYIITMVTIYNCSSSSGLMK